jgi:hypothetical protein
MELVPPYLLVLKDIGFDCGTKRGLSDELRLGLLLVPILQYVHPSTPWDLLVPLLGQAKVHSWG